jgi:hypothetical protein
VLFYAQKPAKQRGFQKVIVLWDVFKSRKTGSDFPLNRFSVCVNVFLWAKMHPKFFEMHPLSRQRETGVPAMIFARYAGLF